MAKLKSKIDGTTYSWKSDDIRDAEISAIVNNSCKNIVNNIEPNSSEDVVTWTVNSDKSVTVDSGGQVLSYDLHHTINSRIDFKPGRYIISGGINNNLYVELLEVNGYSTGIGSYGSEMEFTVESDHRYWLILRARAGITINNQTFYPMIRDARIIDSTYVPYTMSNVDLTTNSLVYKRNLISGEDLNNITETGFYDIYSGTASGITNKPPTVNGSLNASVQVIFLPTIDTVQQTYIEYSGGLSHICVRRRWGGNGWSSWRELAFL